MFIRRKPNKSGSFSVQVLDKRDGRNILLRSFGSSKEETELLAMEHEASNFIACYGGQGVLNFKRGLPPSAEEEADMFFSRIIDVKHDAPRIILSRVYDGIGFGAIGDDTLRLLAIARVCEPKSKVATVEYLKRCFREDYRLHRIYRYMDTLYNTQRELIQQISVEHTRKLLGGRIGIVFYDVTTLYFETAREDTLRSPGFSKDGKTAESQIVLGLLVSRDGYPLSYNVFNGAQYEGRTMIPIIDDFVQRFSLTDFIVVADAGLLSRKNITLLKQAGYKFILGGRIKKESKSVQDWVLSLEKDPHKLNETVINGDERIIISYSEQRAVKDSHNRDKGIQRLRKAYSSGKIKKQNVNQRGYNKFLVIENDVMVSIDEAKIVADAQWDGLKSYVTNTNLPASEVINQYHGLWVVERAFRITKGTLEARPIFHFTERRIEAHICICFVAYKLYKELERLLPIINIPLSVDKVLDIAKTISTVTIRLEDGTTRSRTLLNTAEERQLAPLFPD
ncbi:MAG: IS1634 family transposase [Muribaculaceae bacterium]|nr:IS1634 family transposase [Muribaculaceae bacterium]